MKIAWTNWTQTQSFYSQNFKPFQLCRKFKSFINFLELLKRFEAFSELSIFINKVFLMNRIDEMKTKFVNN